MALSPREKVRKKINKYGWTELEEELAGMTDEQSEVLCMLMSDDRPQCVVVSGVAGCGKSHIIKFFLKFLNMCTLHKIDKELHNEKLCRGKCSKTVGAVAPTGVAALCIDGVTLDSYLGCKRSVDRTTTIRKRGVNPENVKEAYADLKSLLDVELGDHREMLCTSLVIDECYMMQGAIGMMLLRVLEEYPCSRYSFFGDPYQLLPVSNVEGWQKNFDLFVRAFSWQHKEMKQLVRARDPVLKAMVLLLRECIIQNITFAFLDDYSQAFLQQTSSAMTEKEFNAIETEKMIVCYRNKENHTNNMKYLASLPGDTLRFDLQCEDVNAKPLLSRLIGKNEFMKDFRIYPRLELKENCIIMTTRNSGEFKNGTVCRFLRMEAKNMIASCNGKEIEIGLFAYEMTDEKSEEKGGKKITYEIRQYPVMVAYSITVYKTQGTTCNVPLLLCPDYCIDMRCLYVIISRIRDLKMLYFKKPLTCRFFPQCFVAYGKRKRDQATLSLKSFMKE